MLTTALMRSENQDTLLKMMRKLGEYMFPEGAEVRQAHEEAMREVLRREGQKSYKVDVLRLGERKKS